MLVNIILYLLQIIQYQYKVIGQLLNFICRYIPLKQHAFDDSHSPKYQKFKDCSCPRCKAPIMSFCLTFRVNLGLSLRKTAQALKDLYNIDISHQQAANYCKTFHYRLLDIRQPWRRSLYSLYAYGFSPFERVAEKF